MPACNSLSLKHTKPKLEDFEAWHQSLNLGNTAQQVRHVIIHSTHADVSLGQDYEVRLRWEEGYGRYPAFEAAIDRIVDLPLLEALELRFSDQCQGYADAPLFSDGVEEVESRINTLKTVFGALDRRAADPNNSAVQSLTIENLQNTPIREITNSNAFKNAMNHVKELHLSILTEYNEAGPDGDVYKPERQIFEPFLQEAMLAPIAQNLTTLSLKFDEAWGTAPGQFNGRGLLFPRLESLTLEKFVIGHHDHFDWVYAQKTLKSLHLKEVRILSHFVIDEPNIQEWGIRTDDWKSWPHGAFGYEDHDPRVFTFAGTWETVLDSIRAGLPNLVDFRLDDLMYPGIEDGLSFARYIAFNQGILPSPWIEADYDGELSEFPEVWPEDELDDDRKKQVAIEDATLNPATNNERGDKRALDELLKAVKQRQG